MTSLTVNGKTYSDDFTSSNDMNLGGFRTNYMPMVSDSMVDLSTKQAAAAASATAAAASALTALNAPGTTASCANALALATGSMAFTIQTGKTLVPGMTVRLADSALGASWFQGNVTSYNSATGALVVNVTSIQGAGTPANLALSLAPSGGAGLGSNNFTGAQNFARATSINLPTSLNLDAIAGNSIATINATVDLTSITLASGSWRRVIFPTAVGGRVVPGASLIVPGGQPIIIEAGDSMEVFGEPSGVVRVTSYTRASGAALVDPYFCVQEQFATGVSAGNSQHGPSNSRNLNTVLTNNIPGVSVSSGVINMTAPGKYLIQASAPCYGGGSHQLSIVGGGSGAISAAIGTSEVAPAGAVSRSTLRAIVTLTTAQSQSITLGHFIQNAVTNGLGLASGSGNAEIYAQVEIWRL